MLIYARKSSDTKGAGGNGDDPSLVKIKITEYDIINDLMADSTGPMEV